MEYSAAAAHCHVPTQVHARDVVHNNLSLENILVRGGGEELGLAGFGLSLRRSFVRVITASGYLRAKRTLATAPEIRRAIDDVVSKVRAKTLKAMRATVV